MDPVNERLRDWRAREGLTQAEMGARLGELRPGPRAGRAVKASLVGQWERGELEVTKWAADLVERYCWDVPGLLEGEEERVLAAYLEVMGHGLAVIAVRTGVSEARVLEWRAGGGWGAVRERARELFERVVRVEARRVLLEALAGGAVTPQAKDLAKWVLGMKGGMAGGAVVAAPEEVEESDPATEAGYVVGDAPPGLLKDGAGGWGPGDLDPSEVLRAWEAEQDVSRET